MEIDRDFVMDEDLSRFEFPWKLILVHVDDDDVLIELLPKKRSEG